MTLLTTELHPGNNGGVIVFAADRRITRGTTPSADQKKIFRIQGMSVGIGYFGLAEVPTSVGNQPMADWVQDFLYTVQHSETIGAIAGRLAHSLNSAVPLDWKQTERSGFHLAGFSSSGRAEFWFVRNVDDNGNPTLGQYEAREDFQRRDAPNLAPGQAQIYRNGDIRAHVAAWERLDEAFGSLLAAPDFRSIQTTGDYLGWVQFKMKTIAAFYERYCTESIIGEPIDAFAFSASQFEGV